MNAIASPFLEALTVLGYSESSDAVQRLVSGLSLTERQDDPPFRHYLSCAKDGVSFLFEDEHLLDLQIFVMPTRVRGACPHTLPFGLMSGMAQADVHRVLGQPLESSHLSSVFELPEFGARLVASYGNDGQLKYLSLGRSLRSHLRF